MYTWLFVKKLLFFCLIFSVFFDTSLVALSAMPSNLSYVSQFDEPALATANCGAAVLKMLAEDSTLTFSAIREAIGNTTREIYLSEFVKGLEVYNIDYSFKEYTEPQDLISLLDEGGLVTLLIDMTYIPKLDVVTGLGKNVESLNTGHFVIVTGYILDEYGDYILKVIDPFNPRIGSIYLYPVLSYFGLDDVDKAITNWSLGMFKINLKEPAIEHTFLSSPIFVEE